MTWEPEKPPGYAHWSSPANEISRSIRGHRSSIRRGVKTTVKGGAYVAVAGMSLVVAAEFIFIGIIAISVGGLAVYYALTNPFGRVVLFYYGLPTAVAYVVLRILKLKRDRKDTE